ncbi:hypothetical protein FOCC_FOCC002824 [Frankliniella occidentalis]|nr:hypothetical protein FOCC_FOCC002824 [Frankliniella occidentalis]
MSGTVVKFSPRSHQLSFPWPWRTSLLCLTTGRTCPGEQTALTPQQTMLTRATLAPCASTATKKVLLQQHGGRP